MDFYTVTESELVDNLGEHKETKKAKQYSLNSNTKRGDHDCSAAMNYNSNE